MSSSFSLRLAATLATSVCLSSIGTAQIIEIGAPTVAGSTIDTGLLPIGPITLAALNAAGTPAGGQFANITLSPSTAALGAFNTQAFKNGLGMDTGGLGNLEIIDFNNGPFGAFNAQLDLTGPSTEIGFGIGDWVGPMILNFYQSGMLVATHTTSTQTGNIIFYQMTGGGTFDRVDVQASTSAGNWVFVDFFVQSTVGLFPGFLASPESGSSPLNVQFTDTSFSSDPGGILAWQWDIDNNGTVDYNTQNPAHVYGSGGTYSVKLDVADAQHGQKSITKKDLIKVDHVGADFTSKVLACTTVQFTDTSTGNPTSWKWDVDNDGMVDYTGTNSPVHTYAGGGIYACKLDVANAFSSDSVTKDVSVQVASLSTLFAANNGGSVGGAVYFDLTVTNTVKITALETNYDATVGSPVGIVMHTTPGTSVGNQTNPGVWTQVAMDNGLAVSAGLNNPSLITLATPVTLNPGSYGIALVAVGDGHRYTNGANNFNDANIAIATGTASNVPFTGGIFSPRSWNGSIIYSPGAGGVDYGAGSPAGLGQNPPTMTTSAPPALGTTAVLDITQFDNTAAGFILPGVGRGPTPLPFVVLNLTAPFPFSLTVGPMPVGTPVQFKIPVPNNCTLAGVKINLQNVNFVAGAPNLVSASNGVEWVVN